MPSQFITVQFGHLRTSGLCVIFYPCREGSWRSASKKSANYGLTLVMMRCLSRQRQYMGFQEVASNLGLRCVLFRIT